jgi:hypothetical protein
MSGVIKGIASAAAVATALTLGLVAHASTQRTAPARAAHAASAEAAEARAALVKFLKNTKPAGLIIRTGLHPGQKMIKSATSNTTAASVNWSGYASWSSTTGEYTSVSGSWLVPTLSCTPEQELVSQWLGFDGFNSNSSTVEQTGTLGYCFEGAAHYYTWYEMAPAAEVTVGSTVKPGDNINAKVTRSGSKYTFTLTDTTTSGSNISTTQTCASGTTCHANSAEWIDERPSTNFGVVPLADTSTWNPGGAATTAGGKVDTIASAPNSTQVVMDDITSQYQLNSVSALSPVGRGFVIHWVNSY